MKEIVTVAQADALFLALLVLGVVAAPIAALFARRKGTDPLAAAFAAGGPLVLIGLMWRAYNALTNRIGLDTVRNLLVNLALFVIVGALCGAAWAWLTARRRGDSPQAVAEGKKPILGELEKQTLDIIEEMDRPVTTTDVFRVMYNRRPLSYATIMLTMAKLAKKGFLTQKRADEGKKDGLLYTHQSSREETEHQQRR